MTVNITECMHIPAFDYGPNTGRKKCIHLDRGVFGGYICKRGNQIELTPRISRSNEICKDKEVTRSA